MAFDEEKDDDEISIDFSKITNFFKKKNKDSEKVKVVEKEAKVVEQEIATELKKTKAKEEILKEDQIKIKEVEQKLESEEKEARIIEEKEEKSKKEIGETKKELEEIKEDVEKEDDDEISIDFSKVKNFFKKVGKSLSEDDEPEVKERQTQSQSTKIVKTKEENPEKDDDEEISFDFTKVKNFFKNIGKQEKSSSYKEKEESEDDLSIDWKAMSQFFIKYKTLFLILIPIILSIFLRVQTAYLPITDEWAQNNVNNYFKDQIRIQIDQQYPNLPSQNKDVLVEREFQKFLQTNKEMMEQQVQGASQQFKSRLQDENGQTYLLAIDPYFWMRHAKNIIANGHPGDELRDINTKELCETISKTCVPWDTHMYAPLGREVPPDMFHAYFEAYLYKFFRIFNQDLDLMKLAFFTPVILATLAVIPAFFIARRLGGNFGGTIAAVIIAIHPAFLTRTAGGFADTDAYNVLFPLLISWLFLEAFETKDLKKKTILGSLAGFLVGLYSASWGGWWYILLFLFATLVIYSLYYIVTHREDIKPHKIIKLLTIDLRNVFILFLSFMVSSMISTSLFTGFNNFINFLFGGPISFMKMKEVGITTVWPNVFTTVAEQNASSLSAVISQIGFGNWFLFLVGISGLILSSIKKKEDKSWLIGGSILWYFIVIIMKPQDLRVFLFLITIPLILRFFIAMKEKDDKIDAKYSILLALWMLSTIYASVKGIRFTLLLVPAFGISFGITLGILYNYLNKWISKELNITPIITKISLTILLILLIISPFKSAMATARNEIPSMNDAWWSSLEKIRLESQPDAIINSWWDFGHWFKYVGDRAVTFDGTSQNSPQAHWIGNTLLTDDEDTAMGILTMLDCGENQAFNTLNGIIKDHPKSVDIIYDIITKDHTSATKVLKKEGLTDEESSIVLDYAHCNPPEDYFITSEDMVGKSGVWSHFGNWDFNRALIYNTLKKSNYSKNLDKSVDFLTQRFNYTEDQARGLYYEVQAVTTSEEANNWIAEWPNYYGTAGCSIIDKNTVECGFIQGAKATIYLPTMEVNVSTQQGIMHPSVIAYPTKDDVLIKEFKENAIPNVGMTLVPQGEGYFAVLSHPKLVASMFTRLFYMEGHGLTHFEKFSDQRGITGGRIIVWKVNWDGTAENVLDKFKPKPVEETTEQLEAKDINNSE